MSDKKIAIFFTVIVLFIFITIKNGKVNENLFFIIEEVENNLFKIDFHKNLQYCSNYMQIDTSIVHHKQIAVIPPENLYGPNFMISDNQLIQKIKLVTVEQEVYCNEDLKGAVLVLSIDGINGNLVYLTQNLDYTKGEWELLKNSFTLQPNSISSNEEVTLKIYILNKNNNRILVNYMNVSVASI